MATDFSVSLVRLQAAVAAVCPILGVSLGNNADNTTATINYAPSATSQQQTAAQSALASFDWSVAAETAWETPQARSIAIALCTDPASPNKLTRAVLYSIGDEFNTLIGWITSFTAAVAAATSLADLKSRVAALNVPATITTSNALTAVQNKINNGAAD